MGLKGAQLKLNIEIRNGLGLQATVVQDACCYNKFCKHFHLTLRVWNCMRGRGKWGGGVKGSYEVRRGDESV